MSLFGSIDNRRTGEIWIFIFEVVAATIHTKTGISITTIRLISSDILYRNAQPQRKEKNEMNERKKEPNICSMSN